MIVMAVIAITLAVSYSVMMSQATSLQVQSNSVRRGDARMAALAGMQVALRKMHQNDWTGVATTVSGDVGENERYEATYTTGDSTLEPGDSDYWEYPYRVTIVSTGISTDPDTGAESLRRMRAVVRLNPRKVSADPADWTALAPYTAYQWSSDPATIEFPSRIEGPVHLKGRIDLAKTYLPDASLAFHGMIRDVSVMEKDLGDGQILTMVLQLLLGTSPNSLFGGNSPIGTWRLIDSVGTAVAADVTGTYAGVLEGAKMVNLGGSLFGTSRAALFDGYNDLIRSGGVRVDDDKLTIHAAIYPFSFRNTNARIIAQATGTGTSDVYWSLGTTQVGGDIRLRFGVRTEGGITWVTASSGALSTNEWTVVDATYDHDKLKIFKNGSLVGSTDVDEKIVYRDDTPMFIGNCPPGSTRVRLLRDLKKMYESDGEDKRLLTGPIYADAADNVDPTFSILQEDLGLTVSNRVLPSRNPIASFPAGVTTYQLYPGGKTYGAQSLPSNLLYDVTLVADPVDNPLGLYVSPGDVQINGNVSIEGTLLVEGATSDAYFTGQNVALKPAKLPAVAGATKPVRLPTLIVQDDVVFSGGPTGVITGAVYSGGAIVQQDMAPDNGAITIEGKAVCETLTLHGRTAWNLGSSSWNTSLNSYLTQLVKPPAMNAQTCFPKWAQANLGLCLEPVLTIKPESAEVTYHWQDWSVPVFAAHPDDPGLRWDLIEWVDL